jgi:hypothetical protein
VSELVPAREPEDPFDSVPVVETPTDMRQDLTVMGILEHERGVCEDTYENRQILRKNLLNWDPVYDQSGRPTGLIAARSREATKERRLLSLQEKKPLLVDQKNRDADFLTGYDLVVDDAACSIVPPWVLGATRAWIVEQENGGPKSERRAPAALPHRCRMMKSDGIRCMLWSSGRVKDDGLCRIHLRTIRKPGEDVERARLKLMQAAPYAVDVLEELMESAESEPVRLKASTEILDRAGVRGGQDFNIGVEVTDARPAATVIFERLAKLAEIAASVQRSVPEETDITDAEIVFPAEETSTTESVLEVERNGSEVQPTEIEAGADT